MQRYKPSQDSNHCYGSPRSPNLGDLLTTRPSGLTEPEAWAVLCQSVQALQDLFLSDGATSNSSIPLVTPSSLILSSKGRVELYQNAAYGFVPPPHLSGYLAPEYRPNKHCSDTETEKMWIYALGETMKRATLTSHAATSRLSGELCRILADMTRFPVSSRASLMNLLDVISEYCKKRHQNRPFSHIVMDLHQEAMAAIELVLDTPWGPPAMPELRPRTAQRIESNNIEVIGTIPRRWLGISKSKSTKEASTSMEDLTYLPETDIPGSVRRPKSMCVPDSSYFASENIYVELPTDNNRYRKFRSSQEENHFDFSVPQKSKKCSCTTVSCDNSCAKGGRNHVRRNPVQRAASRLYSAGKEISQSGSIRDCIGPEFVVRATLPNKKLTLPDPKGNSRKNVLVILLNGQKLDILCNPNTTTAGELFELIIQKEHIEENFMLGISALVAGDFVFLPSDTKIYKAMQSTTPTGNISSTLTLFMRVRFFLPSLRGIRSSQARHLLYLQLRRSILEHQLPCSFSQLIELDGLAMQAEFGDYNKTEHGTSDYFLLEHYVPETMSCAIDDHKYLRQELIKAHQSKSGMDQEKAEQDFISIAQKLTHYGGHFYTATWILKDNNQKDVWLYISAQGINLYERGHTSNCGPQLYEMFDWKNIQTLCYSKRYLCILPHINKLCSSKLKKYKLKMDHKKSYFTFRLASLHHQFFLRLRTEYTSLQTLAQQFGIPLKDMKNETNSLYKLEALTNPMYMALDLGTVNADTEFKIDFRPSSRCSDLSDNYKCRRSKSANDFTNIATKEWRSEFTKDETDDKESLDGNFYSELPNIADKRRGVKMGTRAIGSAGSRISRSMEAVNTKDDCLEGMSLESISLHCSSNSVRPTSGEMLTPNSEIYVLDSTIKDCSNALPDFQETLSESLVDKFNNISFAEERVFSTVTLEKDRNGSLGMQITQGSDGNVYIQSVIPDGPAHSTGNIARGDQIVAADHRNLLGMKYEDALNLLKTTGPKVEFIISRIVQPRKIQHSQSTLRLADVGNLNARINLSNMNESYLQNLRLENTMNKLKYLSSAPNSPRKHCIIDEETPIEKHVTESCLDLSNTGKYRRNAKSEVPYHKHIRYEIEPQKLNEIERAVLRRNVSMSCNRIFDSDGIKDSNYLSLDRKLLRDLKSENQSKTSIPPIALPRSLGLGRKWRGPVRYPVTPVKKSESNQYESYECNTTSDEEQVFI